MLFHDGMARSYSYILISPFYHGIRNGSAIDQNFNAFAKQINGKTAGIGLAFLVDLLIY